MGEDMTDIHLAAVEMNNRNQSILIPTNIEHNPLANFIR